MSRIIKIGAGYDGEKTFFYLRNISVADENRYTKRFLEIPANETEERKAEKDYEICVDSLSSWAAQSPTKIVTTDEGEEVEHPVHPDFTREQSIKEMFKERTPENERLVLAIIGSYRNKLQPEVVFY